MELASWLQAGCARNIQLTTTTLSHLNNDPPQPLNFFLLGKMKLINSAILSLLSLASAALAASSWSFEDATLTVQGKGAGVGGGGGVKEKCV